MDLGTTHEDAPTEETAAGPSSPLDLAPGGQQDSQCENCGKIFIGNSRKINCKKHHDNPPAYCLRSQMRAVKNPPNLHSNDNNPPDPSGPQRTIYSRLANLQRKVFLPDHIPGKVRHLVAGELDLVLRRILSENTESAWICLLVFWFAILGQPREKKPTDASIVNAIRKNIQCHPSPEDNCCKNEPTPRQKSRSSEALRVDRKLKDGNISGAVKVLAEDDSVCKMTPEVLKILAEKHPTNSPISPEHPTATPQQLPELGTEELARYIRSFPGGSAGGPDGMKPGYLKELIAVRQQSGGALLKSLSGVLIIMLHGEVPKTITPVLYGANLFALKKNDGE